MFNNIPDAQKVKILKGIILGQSAVYLIALAVMNREIDRADVSRRKGWEAFNLVKDHLDWDDPELVQKARDFVTFHEMVDPLDS